MSICQPNKNDVSVCSLRLEQLPGIFDDDEIYTSEWTLHFLVKWIPCQKRGSGEHKKAQYNSTWVKSNQIVGKGEVFSFFLTVSSFKYACHFENWMLSAQIKSLTFLKICIATPK